MNFCDICKKEIPKSRPSNAKRCSEECSRLFKYQATVNWKKKHKTLYKKVCKYCNKPFETYKTNKIKCSPECFYKNAKQKILKKCENCQKDFITTVKSNKKNCSAFCSKHSKASYRLAWFKHKYKNCPKFLLASRTRKRIYKGLRRYLRTKINKSEKILGCTYEEYVVYIESLFTEGMTWQNKERWHIDHIKPVNSFDLTNPEELLACFNYKNTQPLWAKDNLVKSWKEQ